MDNLLVEYSYKIFEGQIAFIHFFIVRNNFVEDSSLCKQMACLTKCKKKLLFY